LKKSCSRLNLKSTTIIKADAITWLNENNIKEPFDIIFLDPPFMSNLIPMCCEILERGGLLSKPSYIYIEATRHQTTATVPKNWVLLRDNLAGQVAYKLYLRN
jgi:16S rRNA (guanine966-N2)-methyltransferase